MNYFKRISQVQRLSLYLSAGAIVVVFGFPVYWLFISSVKPLSTITSYPPVLIPDAVTLSNYLELANRTRFLTWLRNSIVISLANVGATVLFASMAGYALNNFGIPFKRRIAQTFIFTYMFPPMLLSIPYFIIFDTAGLTNTMFGMVLAHMSISLPFGVWIMWQYFQTIPPRYEESAWISGASRFRSMIEVAFPAAAPGMVATAIFSFAFSWNDFTFALILLSDPDKKVITTGINGFIQGTETFWGMIITSGAVLVLPPFLLVLFLNKYILEGFTFGQT